MPQEMDSITHHGRTTAYTHRGDGTNEGILCVHGSGGTHAVWRAQLARLAADRPITALDLSGHGQSDNITTAPGEPTLNAYADDVLAVATETDADILCGNSLGGAVILHIALTRNFDPSALLLVGTGARLAVLADLLDWLQTDFEQAISFLHQPGRLFHNPPDKLIDHSKGTMRTIGSAVTYRDFKTCDVFDVRDDLSTITTPTLAVTGEHDGLTPPWYHEYLSDTMPTADWTTIPDAAHLSMLESPTRFNQTVHDFLSEL